MAEHVHQRVEDMLGELDEMTKIGLFSEQETRIILKKRQAFEYKIQKQKKDKNDYLGYIQYEIHVLELVKKRSWELGIRYHETHSVKTAVLSRIVKLFQILTKRFSNDESIWLSFIELSKNQDEDRSNRAQVSYIYMLMLKVLNRSPRLWIMAANWEIECDNATSARNIMQRGLRFNPESQILWVQYFKMELMLTKTVREKKRKGIYIENADAVLCGKIAEVVYSKASEAFKSDVTVAIELLNVADQFDFTQSLQQSILKNLHESYGDKEETWDLLARRSLNQSTIPKAERLPECHKIFQEAISKIPTEKMWTFYIKFCHEIIATVEDDEQNMMIQMSLDVHKAAAEKNCLSKELYLNWIETLLKVGLINEAEFVSSQSVQVYADDVNLWLQRLQLIINQRFIEKMFLKLFKKCKSSIPVKSSWPVWRVTLEYLLSINSTHLIPLLEEGSSSPVRELCVPVKEWYLHWYILSHSLAESRQLYSQLIQKSSTSLQFYLDFLAFELSRVNPRLKRARQIYEDAIRTYGTAHIDLWLDFIKFETSKGEPMNVAKLHSRAVRTLDSRIVDDFITHFTLLQNGHET